MKSTLLCLLPLVVLACTCVTEGDREVNRQTRGAADEVANDLAALQATQASWDQKSLDLFAKAIQAVKDIQANTATLIKNQGEPKMKQDYSPKASADARAQSDKDALPWYKNILNWIAGAAAAVGSVLAWFQRSALANLVLGLIPGPAGAIVRMGLPVVEGLVDLVGKLKDKADANPDDKLALSDIVAQIEAFVNGLPPDTKKAAMEHVVQPLLTKLGIPLAKT